MATHEIGDKVYYTGDRANRARWLTVQSVAPDNVILRDTDEPETGWWTLTGRFHHADLHVFPAAIGDTYRGHHDPRYVTWDAYNAYHREIYLAHLARRA